MALPALDYRQHAGIVGSAAMTSRSMPDRAVETERDPFSLIIGAKSIFDGLREFLMHADDNTPGGWPTAMADVAQRRRVLDQLAFAGAILARLTVLVANPIDPLTEQLRDDVNAELALAAWEVAAARLRVALGKPGTAYQE